MEAESPAKTSGLIMDDNGQKYAIQQGLSFTSATRPFSTSASVAPGELRHLRKERYEW